MPVLIIHGDRDQIIPFQFGEQVFAAALPPKEFYRVDGADHNNLYSIGGTTYFRRLRQFVQHVTR
jgi:hypothetical protein